jgi:hypothetical protein
MSSSWNFPARRAEPNYEGSEPSRDTSISELKPAEIANFELIFVYTEN